MRLTIILALFAITSLAAAQQAAAPEKYPQSEIQHLRLVNKQQAAQLAQVAYQNASANMNAAYNELIAESAKVKSENKWADSVKFDLTNVRFCDKLNQQGQCALESAAPEKDPAK